MPKTVERLYLPAFQLFPQGANMQSIMPWLGILVLILSGWAVVKKYQVNMVLFQKTYSKLLKQDFRLSFRTSPESALLFPKSAASS